jgi:hypothetical protein
VLTEEELLEADLHVYQNLFSWYNAFLLVHGEHFQHILLNGKFLSINLHLIVLIWCFHSHSGTGVGKHVWPHQQSRESRIVSKQNFTPV